MFDRTYLSIAETKNSDHRKTVKRIDCDAEIV